jgi:TolA-binding protein
MSGSCYIKEGEAIHRRAVESARLAAEKAKRQFNANQSFLPFASVENYTRAVNAFVDMAEKYQAVTTPELRAQGLYWAGDASLRKEDVKSAYIFLKRAVLEYPETEWARRARGLMLQKGKAFKNMD